MRLYARGLFFLLLLVQQRHVFAQNPFITTQYSADPSARVFGDRVYVFPSHDILAAPGKGRPGWFCMEDYHVFSSSNLTSWTDHGMIVTQNKVPWVKPDSYSMWAPDCIERNGKYYFYFPTTPKDSTIARGFTVGVAVADRPEGPYAPLPDPIKNVKGIDPNVMIDKDGQAYLYWSQGNIYGAKLKENMTELASDPVILGDLPSKGLKEGPYVFERNGIYYMTYPHVENKTERLEYAIGNNPLGPFKVTGVIMDESPTGCWTNHHSILQFKNQWYLFYHHNDFSPSFDKARSVRIDSLSFNADGTIRKVIPTLRGVGITAARSDIHVDRYSAISDKGTRIAFLDTSNRFLGWKTILEGNGAWIQYNSVDFSKTAPKKITARVNASAGSTLQVHDGSVSGPVIATVTLNGSGQWQDISSRVTTAVTGIKNLYITLGKGDMAEIDWIRFQ